MVITVSIYYLHRKTCYFDYDSLFLSLPCSRGPFSKYLIWNKPCLQFDKAPDSDLWSHKQATSFPCKKSVQNLNWVVDWLLPRLQGINAVTVNLIGCIEKLHHMTFKTSILSMDTVWINNELNSLYVFFPNTGHTLENCILKFCPVRMHQSTHELWIDI